MPNQDAFHPGSGARRKWTAAERKALYSKPSFARPLAQSATIALLYLALAWVVVQDYGPLRFLLWPLMGFILAGFLAAAHDCLHNSFARSKRANRIAGTVWCALVLNNYSGIKYAHMVHHRFTRVDGDSERFLTLSGPLQYCYLFLAPQTLPKATLRALSCLVGRYPQHVETSRQRRDAWIDSLCVAAWLGTAAVATILAPKSMLLAYWAPLAFFYPMVIAVAVPEHYACDLGPDAIGATRTTKSNWLVRMLIWNSNYHTEHHLYPSVPSYNFPRLHRALKADLKRVSSGYLTFHGRVIRTLLTRPPGPTEATQETDS